MTGFAPAELGPICEIAARLPASVPAECGMTRRAPRRGGLGLRLVESGEYTRQCPSHAFDRLYIITALPDPNSRPRTSNPLHLLIVRPVDPLSSDSLLGIIDTSIGGEITSTCLAWLGTQENIARSSESSDAMSASTSKIATPPTGRASTAASSGSSGPKPKIPLTTHLVAGGIAGLAEACVWCVSSFGFLVELLR